MPVKVYKISEYDHRAETLQFEYLCEYLCETYSDSNQLYVLIGNLNVEGVELDALLLTPRGIRVLEFKNWGGEIVACENGPWTANGMLIPGGSPNKSPFKQMQINRSRLINRFKRMGMDRHSLVTGSVIFFQDCEIDDSGLSETTNLWLKVIDHKSIDKLMDGMGDAEFTNEEINSYTAQLKIEQFLIADGETDCDRRNSIELESAQNLYDELYFAHRLLPDYRQAYKQLKQVFNKVLNNKTAGLGIKFVGPASKADFLLSDNNASWQLKRYVNNTRVRLRKCSFAEDGEMAKYFLLDFKHICDLIRLVYKEAIPNRLLGLLPAEEEALSHRKSITSYIRIIVSKWDENYIYGTSGGADVNELNEYKVYYGEIDGFDWSYLRGMLREGDQLNLIRPYEDESDPTALRAELYIYNPDYLVDISSLSSCFTEYGETPYTHLLKRLRPNTTTPAILLGNLASQILDEEVHGLPNQQSFEVSKSEFFKENAIALLNAHVPDSFFEEAKLQKNHIASAVHTDLRKKDPNYRPDNVILEPTFFSECLGLQGRLDLLQLDNKLLVEQKSGKGEFYPSENFSTPRAKQEHMVQALLYRAVLKYDLGEKETKTYLLYSKYKEPLLNISNAPDLVRRAIKLRNEIVSLEYYSIDNGFQYLQLLDASHFKKKEVNGNFWERYSRPQIEEVLNPIKNASELERAYFFRFMQFLSTEHMLSKIGSEAKENSGFSSKWHRSLDEKQNTGDIYCDLTMISPNGQHMGKVDEVILGFEYSDDNNIANFRKGDIVVLYPYDENTEPDVRQRIVFRSTVIEIADGKICLRLRSPQTDPRIFTSYQSKKWAIEHDFLESVSNIQFKGLHSFLNAPKDRKDLVLSQRIPQYDSNIQLEGDYGEFDELVLRAKQATDMFLVIGPPGTGKTSFGLMNILKEELLDTHKSILILSYTNRAVDEICSKLKNNTDADGNLSPIDFVRIGSSMGCDEAYRSTLLKRKVEKCANTNEVDQIISQTRIFVGTTASINSNMALLELKHFSLAIIDEASQLLEPQLIGLLSAYNNGKPAVDKFVLIGDQKQLPAVVQQNKDESVVNDTLLKEIGLYDCRNSLFERMLKRAIELDGPDEAKWHLHYILKKQGRMHTEIADFPNYTFYAGMLGTVKAEQSLPLPAPLGQNGLSDLVRSKRFAFIASPEPEMVVAEKVNNVEAQIITSLLAEIYRKEQEALDAKLESKIEDDEIVGVIVPYRNQIAAIKEEVAKLGIAALGNITIDTVERFQGSQRKYIIYGFTVQKYHQLRFLGNETFEEGNVLVDRKLNVALTRAKEHMFVVGNPQLLSNNLTFYKLMAYARNKDAYFEMELADFVKGAFTVTANGASCNRVEHEHIQLSERTKAVFETLVVDELKRHQGTDLSRGLILGKCMEENMNRIAYGKQNITNQLSLFSNPDEDVLLYCYYIMRKNYSSSKVVYANAKPFLQHAMAVVEGRVQFVDVGCGPATCGLSFAETYLNDAPEMVYMGIDISAAMKAKGEEMLEKRFGNKLYRKFLSGVRELDTNYWNAVSELPSLIVFNFSYFFGNVDMITAKNYANAIKLAVSNQPHNKYVVIAQHPKEDNGLLNYKTFVDIIQDAFEVKKSEIASFAYQKNSVEVRQTFSFTIFESR